MNASKKIDKSADKDESFAIELFDPKGGVKLAKTTKLVVTIINDDGICFFISFKIDLKIIKSEKKFS